MESFVGRAANKWYMYWQKARLPSSYALWKFIAQLKVSFFCTTVCVYSWFIAKLLQFIVVFVDENFS